MSGESSKLLKVQVLTPSEGSNIPEIPLFELEHDPYGWLPRLHDGPHGQEMASKIMCPVKNPLRWNLQPISRDMDASWSLWLEHF